MSETADVDWSLLAVDLDSGAVLASASPDRVLRTASVGKLLLLTEVAARLAAGTATSSAPLPRDLGPAVGDSGLWQALQVTSLPRADVAALVAAVSDNLATNVLLADVGLAAVQDRAVSLGLDRLELLDFVRDHRTPALPDTLSRGCAAQWVEFLGAAHRGTLVCPDVSRQLLDWMALSVDHSLVPATWGLDPIAGAAQPDGIRFHGKTGRDDGIRADIGLLVRPDRAVAWAAIANWDPDRPVPDAVRHGFADLGRLIRPS